MLVNAGLCSKHKKARRIYQDSKRIRGSRVYDKRYWRDRIRPAQLRRKPVCEHCEVSGKITIATDVDHIDGDPTNNSIDNLQSLCHSCHSIKTAKCDGSFGHGRGG